MKKIKYQILDVYSDSFGIHIWLISNDGKRIREFRRYRPYFYIKASTGNRAVSLLKNRFKNKLYIEKTFKKDLLEDYIEVYKVTANTPITYLKAVSLIRKSNIVEETDFYNIQLSPAQLFMYERKIFPFCTVEPVKIGKRLKYKKIDSIERTDYEIFDLRILKIKPEIEGLNPKHIKYLPPLSIQSEDGEELVIDDGNTEYLSYILKKKTQIYS
ncbi:hypothetical protein [Persephonella sp.]